MKINQKILEAINEGLRKSLLSFDDVEFDNSTNTLDDAKKKGFHQMYGFKNCKYGDKLYYDPVLGYNLLSGEYFGFCVIETGQLDDRPRFVYNKEQLDHEVVYEQPARNPRGISTYFTWNDAIEKCQEIPNGYLPSINELKMAFGNGLKNEGTFDFDTSYWTSTKKSANLAYAFDDGEFKPLWTKNLNGKICAFIDVLCNQK